MAENKMSLEEARRMCFIDDVRWNARTGGDAFLTDEELVRGAERFLSKHKDLGSELQESSFENYVSLLDEAVDLAEEECEANDPARLILNEIMICDFDNDWDKLWKAVQADGAELYHALWHSCGIDAPSKELREALFLKAKSRDPFATADPAGPAPMSLN